jgi:hypothetical protein
VDIFIEFLPSLIDEYLLLNEEEARMLVETHNRRWAKLKEFE